MDFKPGPSRRRLLVGLSALLPLIAGPASAGPIFDRLKKEAGNETVSAAVPPGAPVEHASAPKDERAEIELGERQALEMETGRFMPRPPIDGYDKGGKPSWRPLTPGEIALLTPIFRHGVDYAKVRIYSRKWNVFQPDNIVMAPNGNIYWPLTAGYSPDISLSGSKWLLVHEMTHVYQHQQGISVVSRRLLEGGIYHYVLDSRKTMNDYTLEQQGNMVADYHSCTTYSPVPECRKRFSPTLSGFLDDPHWLAKDESRRRRFGEPLLSVNP